ncbi:hypothetical protein PV08_09442 [Exophiala spinifera]|uniref:Uncharacterized protein n=1 Tax=Exophiala spinifera TaxID=91928 RepID=A0A0D1ZGS6_9EURO|nr:uncharacterized protein PV08_09442 [Exophiala spinifera]KIW12167.1 hypothetical protein PV08_09442 [Exophiala spinifera]
MASKSKDMRDLPIDESVTFRPTRILYLRTLAATNQHSEILDLTARLHALFHEDITPEFQELAQSTLRANPVFPPVWAINGEAKFVASHLTVVDTPSSTAEREPGMETSSSIAEIRTHLLNFGTVHIIFPAGSTHSVHEIKVEPLSHRSRAQMFTKDSVAYVWDTSSHAPSSRASASGFSKDSTFWGKPMALSGRLSLCKAVAGKRFEVGRYESASGKFELGGLLVVDDREVDILVAALTLVAVLGQNDSFLAPGLDLKG